jgi:hypothetical protein
MKISSVLPQYFGTHCKKRTVKMGTTFNPLNAELNPICHFQALLGAHHILHVSRIRVNKVIIEIYSLWSFEAAYSPKRVHISLTSRRKPEIKKIIF